MGTRHRPATCCSPDLATMAPVVMTNGEPDMQPDMRRSFHEQLADLKADVIRLGGMTVELISGATLALLDSDLGIAPTNDGVVIRLSFPALTEERRKEYVKLAKHYAEEGRAAFVDWYDY